MGKRIQMPRRVQPSNQVGTNIRFALLSTSSNGLYVVYNTRADTVDYLDPHGRDRFDVIVNPM